MKPYARNMTQAATYWPPAGNDGFGGTTYGAPVPLKCRWQNKQVLFRDSEAREVMSEAIVYVSIPVENAGKLYRGVSTDDNPPRGAKEIRSVQESPDLRGTRVLIKAVL